MTLREQGGEQAPNWVILGYFGQFKVSLPSEIEVWQETYICLDVLQQKV
jgi:hypothetical protein